MNQYASLFACTFLSCAFGSQAGFAEPVSGEYLEVQAGWDHVAVPGKVGTSTVVNTGSSRPIYGFGAGYDFVVAKNVIAGIGTNFDFGSKTQCKSGVVVAADKLCGKWKTDWDIGGRVGVQLGKALIYGRAAYDFTRVQTAYTNATGNTVTTPTTSKGIRFGAGFEYGVARGIYVKSEFRFTPSHTLAAQSQILGAVGFRF